MFQSNREGDFHIKSYRNWQRSLCYDRHGRCSGNQLIWQITHRPVIWGGSKGSHDPPPPVTSKLEIYPSNIFQNPPYWTNLQLKMKKIPGGMPPDPPHPRFPFAQCQKSTQAIFYRGFNQLVSKIPQQSKILIPFKNSWARSCFS